MVKRRLYAWALAAAVAAASCGRCGDGGGGQDAAASLAPPVPAPDALLADIYVGSPNVAWTKLQRGVGGAVGILPATAGGIVCAASGLDPGIAAEIDGAAPLYGVLAGDPAAPAWAIAMKLLDGRKARGVLADGDTGRFATREIAGADLTELVAKPGASGPQVALALTPNAYLVLARRSDDLPRLAAYVTRTLPAKPLPPGGSLVADVPKAALASVLTPKLETMWAGAKHFLLAADERMRSERGGRAPDFGDPKAIVAALDAYAKKRIAIVGDLDKLRIVADVADEGLTLVATMTPSAGGGAATRFTEAMKTGDLAPASAFPSSSAVVLSMRDREEDRAEQGQELEKALTESLGSRLAEGDAKKLHDAVADMTKARGETASAALLWDEPQAIVARSAVRDGDAASRAVRGAFELARVSPFKEIFRVKEIASSTDDLAGVGKVSLATVVREPPREPKDRHARGVREGARDAGARSSAPAAPDAGAATSDAGASVSGGAAAPAKRADEVGVAWVVEGESLSVASGDAPLASLRGAVRPERKLADEPAVARSFRALGSDASAVLVVQPLRFDPTRANLPVAPLVVALGRKDKEPFLRVDVAHGLLRELARWQMGL